MINYTWSFPQFIVDPIYGGLPNVVTAINWVCTGTDGVMTSSASGTAKLGTPNPAEFTPYADITQEMAYQWVSGCISMPGVEAQIAGQIAMLSKPIVQPQNPPF
jgi:hypothetical protein